MHSLIYPATPGLKPVTRVSLVGRLFNFVLGDRKQPGHNGFVFLSLVSSPGMPGPANSNPAAALSSLNTDANVTMVAETGLFFDWPMSAPR